MAKPASNPSSDSLYTARRRYFTDGTTPRGLVPDTILRSWQRCTGLGLSAATRPDIEPLTQQAMRVECDRHEELSRLCQPEMRALYADARATGSIVILASPEGLILDALGSADFLDKASRVSLRPGVPWSEAATGTNAIGTAMIEGRPLEVRGGEHFFAPHRVLSCSAVPIIDAFGKIAGVLDLSGESSVHHTHALGMVRMAVDQIEHRLFERKIQRALPHCRVLRVQREAGLFGTPHEGVLVFDGQRLAAANRYGLHALGLERGDIGRRRFDDIFDRAKLDDLHGDTSLRDAHGKPVLVRINSMTPRPRAIAKVTTPRVALARTSATPCAPVFDATLDYELDRAQRVLAAGMSVLLLGETGTGKEVFARELHRRLDPRAPFIAVNCAGLPESLIESELFGYEEGAFTGARRHGAKGLLREADGGVLFLDEIGDMPPTLQPRLLRVLQEREVTPLGGSKPVKVDFTLIAATHRQLDGNTSDTFRDDLYFRIADYSVRLPSLRERPDRGALIEHFWQTLTADADIRLDAAALELLAHYDWPGNLRQLTGTLRTLIALAGRGGVVRAQDLPALILTPRATRASTPSLPMAREAPASSVSSLDDMTEHALRDALARHAGNVSAAARSLRISRSTFYRRLTQSA